MEIQTETLYRCVFAMNYPQGAGDVPLGLDCRHVFLRGKRVSIEGSVWARRFAQTVMTLHASALISDSIVVVHILQSMSCLTLA